MLQFRLLRMAFVPWMVFAFAVASTGIYSLVPAPSAEASSDFLIKAGGYYGNGTSLSISGLGFTPTAVIVRSDTALSSIWQSSAASGTTATHLGIVTADNTGSGIALSADGFTVSPVPEINTANIHYTYFALAGSGCSPGGMMCVGLYTGDGTASRTITTPDVAGSFTVGSTDNTNGNVYYYVAFKNVTQAPASPPTPSSDGADGSPATGGESSTGGSAPGDTGQGGVAPGDVGTGEGDTGGVPGDPGDPGQGGVAPGDVGTGEGDTGAPGPAPSSDSSSGFSIGDAVGFGISNSVTGAVASAFGIGTPPSSPAAVGLSAVGLGLSLGLGPIGMAVAIGLAVADSVTNGQVSNAVDGFFGGVLSAIGNAVMGVASFFGGLFGGIGDTGEGPGGQGFGEGESSAGQPGAPGEGTGNAGPGGGGPGGGGVGGAGSDSGAPAGEEGSGAAPGAPGAGAPAGGDAPGDAGGAPGDAPGGAPGDGTGNAGPGGGGPGGGDAGGAGGDGDGGK